MHAAEALWVAVFYAATDEFHQTFVPSREGCVRDVMIDSTGAIVGLLALWWFGRWRKFW
jgi:VanZ family protein